MSRSIPQLSISKKVHKDSSVAILAVEGEKLSPQADVLSKEDIGLINKTLGEEPGQMQLPRYDKVVFFCRAKKHDKVYMKLEAARKAGSDLQTVFGKFKQESITLLAPDASAEMLLAFAEGLALADYKFLKYRKKEAVKSKPITNISLYHKDTDKKDVKRLQWTINGTYHARDLVNEPVIFLSAEQLGKEAEILGKEAGFKTEVLNKKKIQSLKMGGLLAVNAGSQDPPVFIIMEHKPKKAVNKKPIILVGKGVVYDTGGLSLKPTAGSMDTMKSDMAGSAAVIGAMYAIAGADLPVHVIGLVPATDNRPGERAVTPGDVITMFDGTTVEVLNTDAEGRLILADALAYAKKYDPELVFDLATLTGAAARAIGIQATVYMGTAGEDVKKSFEESAYYTYERLVEFPLWDEYGEMIKSDIADIKNIGGAEAGAITAGKFLQHFTDYPWLHLDIAGPSFLGSRDSYRSKNATGVGVRLLFDYLHKKGGK